MLAEGVRSVHQCAVKGGVFQWVQIPPGDGSLQPEAVEAIVEVTKRSKPSAMVTSGDLASVQAGT